MYHLFFEHRFDSLQHLSVVDTLETLALMCMWEVLYWEILLNDGWWLNTLVHTRVKMLLVIGLKLSFRLFHYLRVVYHIHFTFLVKYFLFNSNHLISVLKRWQVSICHLDELVGFDYLRLFWVEHGLHSRGHGQAFQGPISDFVLDLHFLEPLRMMPALVETIKVPNIFGLIPKNVRGFISFRDNRVIFFQLEEIVGCIQAKSCWLCCFYIKLSLNWLSRSVSYGLVINLWGLLNFKLKIIPWSCLLDLGNCNWSVNFRNFWNGGLDNLLWDHLFNHS